MRLHSIHDVEPQLAANRQYWCGWAGALPDTSLPIYRSGIKHSLLNGVLRVRARPLDRAIEEAGRLLTGSQWSWWVGADSDEGTAEGLIAHGAKQAGDMPIMAVDVTTIADAEPPAHLKIVPVTGRKDMQEYVRAYAGPLGFSGDIDAVVDRELGFAYPTVVRLAGVAGGKTVGTCTLSLGTEVGALYCIATDPEYRRRGIATALTRQALRITRESGRHMATLQASREGEPVYRNIGFETVARYRLFHFPE
jgi:ribosomal protein S18 acetylase RimI-like enzyme